MLRNAKRPANIRKLPRTPGHRPFQACLNTTGMANEPENKKAAARIGRPNRAAAAATRKLPTPRLVRKARFAKDMTFPGGLHSPQSKVS
jgi:hypothetical protein